MRRASLVLILSACFNVPGFEDGFLRCDRGQCPPDMECRLDDRCYRRGAVSIDAAVVDGPVSLIDASAPAIDALPCTSGDRRCNGNLEVCQGGGYVGGIPSCADQSGQCFDPEPAGGSDAYCGNCLKGAQQCTATSPSVRQTCPVETGLWADVQTCDASFGCFDSDGIGGPAAYCGECLSGDKRCSGNGLQTCNQGQWSTPEDCTATAGFTCFDPAPSGGTDAYCGVCDKGAVVCHGDSRDQCNGAGTAFVNLELCSDGCNPSTTTCCSPPTCDVGQICGPSSPNACGRAISCGPCTGTCCGGGTDCCLGSQVCCSGLVCCNSTCSCEIP